MKKTLSTNLRGGFGTLKELNKRNVANKIPCRFVRGKKKTSHGEWWDFCRVHLSYRVGGTALCLKNIEGLNRLRKGIGLDKLL